MPAGIELGATLYVKGLSDANLRDTECIILTSTCQIEAQPTLSQA